MGVDLTLLPDVPRRSDVTPFLRDSLCLDRDCSLWRMVEAASSHEAGEVTVITEDGWRKVTTTPYGAPLHYVLAGDLAAAVAGADTSPWNAAVLAFVAALPADVPIYLWWC